MLTRPGIGRRLAGIAAGGLLILAVAQQLVLPWLAERRVAGELRDLGTVRSVDVQAFPALRLLWGSADRIAIAMSRSTIRSTELGDLLVRTREVERLDVRVDQLRVGPLLLSDARTSKRGAQLESQASVRQGDLAAALPPGIEVQPAVEEGELVFQAAANVLGIQISSPVAVQARDGRVLLTPRGGLLAVVGDLTLFSDPRVLVEDVGARPRPDGFTVTASARLAPEP